MFVKATGVAAVVVALLTAGIAVPADAHLMSAHPVTTYCHYKVVTVSDPLNVRANHDLQSGEVNEIPKGTIVVGGLDGTAVGDDILWRQVVIPDSDGWAAARYLQRTSQTCFN